MDTLNSSFTIDNKKNLEIPENPYKVVLEISNDTFKCSSFIRIDMDQINIFKTDINDDNCSVDSFLYVVIDESYPYAFIKKGFSYEHIQRFQSSSIPISVICPKNILKSLTFDLEHKIQELGYMEKREEASFDNYLKEALYSLQLDNNLTVGFLDKKTLKFLELNKYVDKYFRNKRNYLWIEQIQRTK